MDEEDGERQCGDGAASATASEQQSVASRVRGGWEGAGSERKEKRERKAGKLEQTKQVLIHVHVQAISTAL